MISSQAIGVFDSGIGGLTVAHAIHKVLPNEQIIYFGDTAHLPYGDKSKEAIISYSIAITKFLQSKNCKAIVIACNTASSLAYQSLLETFNHCNLPIYNVIDPVVLEILKSDYLDIGVIGTKATISSNIFTEKINQKRPDIRVKSLATPLLAPMIEEGFFNNKISATIIDSYLSSPILNPISCLVLACTHYPLIQKELSRYYNNEVDIINSAEIVALYVQKNLAENNLLRIQNSKVTHQFYVSDYTQSFEQSAQMFFNEKIELQKHSL